MFAVGVGAAVIVLGIFAAIRVVDSEQKRFSAQFAPSFQCEVLNTTDQSVLVQYRQAQSNTPITTVVTRETIAAGDIITFSCSVDDELLLEDFESRIRIDNKSGFEIRINDAGIPELVEINDAQR